jgi:hypothetical protein
MSWSTSLRGNAADVRKCESTSPPNLDGGPREQFEKARELAAQLIESEAVGDPEHNIFAVSLNGHANPGHVPAEGYANDMITISVSQAPGSDS